MVPNRIEVRQNNLLLPQCWVGTSMIALLSGVIMVLVFCRVLIVPYLLTEDFVSTDCVISSVELLEDTNNISCSRTPGDDILRLDKNFTYCEASPHITTEKETNLSTESINDEENLGLCVVVNVSYRAFDGLVQKATLKALPRKFDEIGRERPSSSEHVSCFMIDSI